MKKRYLIILIVLFILSVASFIFLRFYPRFEIDYPRSDIKAQFTKNDFKLLDIKILKGGQIVIDNKGIETNRINEIISESFKTDQEDIFISLHMDRNAQIGKLKPLMKCMLVSKEKCVYLAFKHEEESTLNYFPVLLQDDGKSKLLIELTNTSRKQYDRIGEQSSENNFIILCTEDLIYDRFIDIMTKLYNYHSNNFNTVILKIKEVSTEMEEGEIKK